MKILIKELNGSEDEVLVYLTTDDDISVKCEIAKAKQISSIVKEFDTLYQEPIIKVCMTGKELDLLVK